ncbi:hypothetical protein AWB64_00419 [Caballeronia sordidicola]|uniref:Uncharacterized protein n=1 Tax=Caballeronia sordidicola TaxID=196367 RepID=A0A158EVS9_CABSO|nr:hypothetical protein AWB64_00419 [Caballeronia sordidicola]
MHPDAFQLLGVVLVGRIRDCIAGLRDVLASASSRIAACKRGGSCDQQQSDESSHEQFPLSMLRLIWALRRMPHMPEVRIPATPR